MRMKRSIIFMVLTVAAFNANAQIVTVRSAFGQDSIMLGEQLLYSLTVESDKDVKVDIPLFSDTITGAIEIISASSPDTTYESNRRILKTEYLVTSFEPGWNTVPPLPVAFEQNELRDTIYTTVQLLTVLAPAVDTTQAIRPIKPPVNTPLSFAEILPWALAGIGTILLIILAVLLVRKYTGKPIGDGILPARPPEPAHIVAFRELSRLKADRFPQKGMVREYYTRLTTIVRVYITQQFGIHAMESTTSEILQAFSLQNNGDQELNEMLKELLLLADLVKFAREDPAPQENDLHFANAERFVEKTYRMFYTEKAEGDDAGEASDTGEAQSEIDVEPVKMEKKNG
jgi:hypothetical protein